jgi:molybdenum cofactor guanylyltransferase
VNQAPRNGYILAGGKSSRMGSDKGLLMLRDKKIVEYVIENLRPCVDQIFIVSSNDFYREFGLPLVPDLMMGKGPAVGIFSALEHSTVNQNFVISCDTPFVKAEYIFRILMLAKDHEICIPQLDGFWEPMVGVYSKSIADRWKQSMLKGDFKLQRLIEQFDYKMVDVKMDLSATENIFLNINSPEELLKAEKWLK